MLLKTPLKLIFSKAGQMTYWCKPVLSVLLKIVFFHSILIMSLVSLTISDIIPRLSHFLWNLTAKMKISRLYKKNSRKKMTLKITLLNLFQSIYQAVHVIHPCAALRPNKIIPVSGFPTYSNFCPYPKHFIKPLRKNLTFMNKMSLIFPSALSLILNKVT